MDDRVAFLLLVHAVDDQLRLLVDALLADPRSRVVVHLDAKCAERGRLAALAGPGVTVMSRHRVHWAGFSIVRVTRDMLRAALADPAARRFVLLSGACFPLRPAAEVNDRVLAGGADLALWGAIDPADPAMEGLGRAVVTKFHFNDVAALNLKTGPRAARAWQFMRRLNRRLPFAKRLPREGVWKGSQFFVADRPLAERFAAPQPALERLLRHSAAPDETFFATLFARDRLARGLPLALTREGDERQAAHFIRKRRVDELDGAGDLRRLRVSDVPAARASGALFARKCDLATVRTLLAQAETPSTGTVGARA